MVVFSGCQLLIMKNPWILPAAALLIGGAGGFVAGKNGTSSTSTAPESTATTSRSSRASASGGGESSRTASNRSKSIDDIRTKPGQLGRIQALMDFYQNLDAAQLEAEAAKLENLPINERIMASILLFGRWAETDPLSAMAYSDKMGMAGMFAKPTILQGWASTDPENAAKYFAEHPREFAMMGMGPMGGGRNGGSGASVIAAEWAKSNPEAALAWAQTLKGNDKDQAMSSVVREISMTNPQKAVQLAATMEGEARTNAYESIAAQWGARNFSEAEAWIKSLPADQQDAAMASAIRSLASQNPQAASTKIAGMADGDAKSRAIGEVVDTWSRQDPKSAAAWLSSQNTESTGRAMRELMGNWARQDDAGALAYLTSQPAGEARDEATQAYVWSNRSSDPKSVIALAESIGNEEDRQRAVGVAAMQWMQTDPEAAKAYIQSSTTISDEAKQRLQEGGGRGGWSGRGGFGGGRRGGN